MPKQEDRARVFISYSRKDFVVAERLRDSLIGFNFDAYLDIHDIKPGEPWQERIGSLISTAEKVIFLISPDSVSSKICTWEVDHTERLGKSLLPVMVRETKEYDIPGRISHLNFVFLRTEAEYVKGVALLVDALSTNLVWEREKTRINDLAIQWDTAERPRRLLMFAEESVHAAETWRDSHPETSPPPTELQLAFISASRKLRVRRQRTAITLSVGVSIVTIALSIVALIQRQLAIENEDLAIAQQRVAEKNAEEARRNEREALRQNEKAELASAFATEKKEQAEEALQASIAVNSALIVGVANAISSSASDESKVLLSFLDELIDARQGEQGYETGNTGLFFVEAESLYLAGGAFLNKNDYKKAARAFNLSAESAQKLLTFQVDNHDVLLLSARATKDLGKTLTYQKQYDEAVASLECSRKRYELLAVSDSDETIKAELANTILYLQVAGIEKNAHADYDAYNERHGILWLFRAYPGYNALVTDKTFLSGIGGVRRQYSTCD